MIPCRLTHPCTSTLVLHTTGARNYILPTTGALLILCSAVYDAMHFSETAQTIIHADTGAESPPPESARSWSIHRLLCPTRFPGVRPFTAPKLHRLGSKSSPHVDHAVGENSCGSHQFSLPGTRTRVFLRH